MNRNSQETSKNSIKTINVTQSDKIGLIAEKYTCSYYGVY